MVLTVTGRQASLLPVRNVRLPQESNSHSRLGIELGSVCFFPAQKVYELSERSRKARQRLEVNRIISGFEDPNQERSTTRSDRIQKDIDVVTSAPSDIGAAGLLHTFFSPGLTLEH
ncbi:unnamed protein product [Protopolystoma xenopodis]|uniref:Uncharacterized protein n=1 Tax=Protopolystoma xenopodis TaxID=117903 RepID=A0A448WS70_9PLAT|nr:unnamed protein product [Protopolystoma xenopodis]